jgi:hypothetical protein
VPAEPVESARQALGARARRQGRHGPRAAWRVSGVARDARDAHDAVVLVVEGFERRIVEGPIIGHAVQAAYAEVRGAEAREMRAPFDRAAADAVEHERLDRRVRIRDRVIGRRAPRIGIGALVREAVELPIRIGRARGFGRDPAPLLQAGHPQPGLSQLPGHGGSARPGADDQDLVMLHASRPPAPRVPIRHSVRANSASSARPRPAAIPAAPARTAPPHAGSG